mmetsp:Transcript_10233/g.24613  ORF Transcript_10233/g.24613 Transcript_10233/m.24613 type:complete len:343 (-) Transcript_10233:546-1574(-)
MPQRGSVVHHTTRHECEKIIARHAEGRLHLVECAFEVGLPHLEIVYRHILQVVHVHLPREGVRGGTLHQPLQLRARKVLRARRQLGDGDQSVHVAPLSHGVRLDAQDLFAPRLVGQVDLHLHLQPPRAQQRVVDHVLAVGHADEEDVVERVHPIYLGEQLVHHGVVHARRVVRAAALLADRVDLVEDDDVQRRVVPPLGLLRLRVGEEFADVLLRLAHVLAQHLRPVHDLGLAPVEHLADLTRHQRLARARRPEEQHAAHVRDAELLEHGGREDARGEGASEDVGELRVEPADAHLLEVEVRLDDLIGALLRRVHAHQRERRARHLSEQHKGLRVEQPQRRV